MYSTAIQHPRWEEVVKYSHTKRVGAYLIGRTIGEGSFAKVKEALHCTVVEKVAVKIIDKKNVQRDSYLKKNLRREAKLLQLMRHPNIVQLYEVLETENYYYLAMELCSGGPLLNQLGKDKRMNEGVVRHYVRQIASAVGYMHQAGIIHRDLKVENLLLDKNNNIKIIDFGLSNLISNLKPVSRENSGLCVYTGTQCGSPAYAAPEIIANRKYGPKVDVWSIGVNMFAMLSGNLPFVIEPFNLKLLLHRMLKGQMSEFPPNVSTDCKSFVLKLLEPNQVKRLSIRQVITNEWLNEGCLEPLTIPSPAGRISRMDIDPDVTQYANEKLGLDIDHMTNSVIRNKANHISAIYYLLLKKVENRQTCAVSPKVPCSTKDHSDVTAQKLVEEANNLQSNHLKRNSLHFKMALLAGIHQNGSNPPKRNSNGGTVATNSDDEADGKQEEQNLVNENGVKEGKIGDDIEKYISDEAVTVNAELNKQFNEVMNLNTTQNIESEHDQNIKDENLKDGQVFRKQIINGYENTNGGENGETIMNFAMFGKKRKPKSKKITRQETENKRAVQREIYQRIAHKNSKNTVKISQANFSPTTAYNNTYPQVHRRISLGYNRRHSFVVSKTCFSKRTLFYQKLPSLIPRKNSNIRPGSSGNIISPAEHILFQKEKRAFVNSPVGRPRICHNSPPNSTLKTCKRNSIQIKTTENNNNVVGKITIDRKKMKSQIKVVLTDKTKVSRKVSVAAESRKHSVPVDNIKTTIKPFPSPDEIHTEAAGHNQEVAVRHVTDLQPPLISINNDRVVMRKLSAVL